MKNLISRFFQDRNSEKCKCSSFKHLQLLRSEISTRIKESRTLIKALKLMDKAENGECLYMCELCEQLWQLSRAWNWDGKVFLFKVPFTTLAEWKVEQFISPADMLIYSSLMGKYYSENDFKNSDEKCKKDNCENRALIRNVLCENHFIENLQKFGQLPKPPKGRFFEPYKVGNK